MDCAELLLTVNRITKNASNRLNQMIKTKELIRKLEHLGFTLQHGNGSKCKLIPKNKALPFYSVHLNDDGKLFFPLKRFARQHWNLDLDKL
jgi:predicted RNA binding protein YcfA (HicA-like mRNA interferase family)